MGFSHELTSLVFKLRFCLVFPPFVSCDWWSCSDQSLALPCIFPCVLASVLLATLLYCLLFCFVSWHLSFSCLGLSYLLSIACSHEVASLVFWLSCLSFLCVLWDLAFSCPCLLVSLMSWLLTPLGSWLLSSHVASALVVMLFQVISFPLLPSLVSCASV